VERIERMAPVVGSSVCGPLGIAHLPRLWLKATLKAADALAEGYTSGPSGFDLMLLEGLGADPQATFAYLATMPSYLAFEDWIRSHATLDPDAVAKATSAILTFEKPEERAKTVRARVGLNDPSVRTSALLNDLDDWDAMARVIVEKRGRLEPQFPLISASSTGPLGLRHLPRFWMKALLNATGALPPDFNSGGTMGADAFAGKQLAMDVDAACAFIARELPSYLAFEEWVRAHVADLSPETIARYNEAVRTRPKPAEIAERERAELGVDDPSMVVSWLINDLLDYKYIHERMLARRAEATTLSR
jgi:hypothetical protein